MQARHTASTTQPSQGLVAFARAAALGSPCSFGAAAAQAIPASGHQPGRTVGPVHPVAGSA